MPNVLATGIGWLTEALHEHAAESVTYRQGVSVLSNVSAVRGSTPVEATDSQGATLDASWCDWLIRQAGIGGRTPQRGDMITDANGDRWEVLPVDGMQCFRFSSGNSDQMRIHTKRKRHGE